MTPQHLSDEAVAAFADGVLRGHARERATRHINDCPECRRAVQVQREAAWALRSAVAPALPNGLLDRLRVLPVTTPVTPLPTATAPDGTTMLSVFAPVAALVPPAAPPAPTAAKAHRVRPFVITAAAVALAGALTSGSVAQAAQHDDPSPSGNRTTRYTTPDPVYRPGARQPASTYWTDQH
jgi:anti-sigma factor RsiW